MLRRLLAALAGGLVAYGVYSLVIPAPIPARGSLLPPPFAQPAKPTGPGVHSVTSPRVPVAGPTPTQLLIPAIGVDARIEARGLDASRSIAAPADYRDVGWYDLGPLPGQPGNAIINGHVDWWTGDAVFTSLWRVRVGDLIRVVRADGGAVDFKVTSMSRVDANAHVGALFTTSGPATLTLITCSGAWNPATQSDTQRLLVSAVSA